MDISFLVAVGYCLTVLKTGLAETLAVEVLPRHLGLEAGAPTRPGIVRRAELALAFAGFLLTDLEAVDSISRSAQRLLLSNIVEVLGAKAERLSALALFAVAQTSASAAVLAPFTPCIAKVCHPLRRSLYTTVVETRVTSLKSPFPPRKHTLLFFPYGCET